MNHQEALSLHHWKAAMDEEIAALTTRGTWELVTHTVGATIVTCKWITLSNIRQTAALTDIRHDWLLEASLKHMALTMQRQFLLSPVLILSTLFCL